MLDFSLCPHMFIIVCCKIKLLAKPAKISGFFLFRFANRFPDSYQNIYIGGYEIGKYPSQ